MGKLGQHLFPANILWISFIYMYKYLSWFIGVCRGLSCVINGDKPRETSIEELMSYILLLLKYMSDEGFEPPISHEKQVLSLSP